MEDELEMSATSLMEAPDILSKILALWFTIWAEDDALRDFVIGVIEIAYPFSLREISGSFVLIDKAALVRPSDVE